MITSTRRVSADKPEVQIAFSLDESSELKDAEDPFPAFPDLEQRLQPVLPCQSLKESVEVYKDHCKMANEFNQVKHEIARLEDRKKELIAELLEDEKVSMEVERLEEEYRILTEENRNLITVHSERAQQLENLRVISQKRQGSS
ncbi:MAP3K7 C-terminal-like protein [Myxocyprinus asiaticus]|uniref:MAP3K7 C-terminal-like protein n=1 Tax=Myxocyprinus asiaticus TaxID=70543 RepID=UPI0022227226|nr:MAP3K7 C-terminal-like protein [Myxocyprinus asiaticus]XP_051540238.1 MAP3K7 C-terminal-like protein [Myxocyprinus asiaticus]XP_051540239.1 MAP3K7 C-terminal-like protein [Myxocyprinus asiaticus]